MLHELCGIGFERTDCDVCEFGLRADGEHLSKKPTGLLTNSLEIKLIMSRRCSGQRSHRPTLNGLPRKAQEYTEDFLKGLRRQVKKDGWEEVQEEGAVFWEEGDPLEEDDEDDLGLDREIEEQARASASPKRPEAERGEAEGRYEPTKEEKEAVKRLHRNTGHPSKSDMIRFMWAARVRTEVIRWTSREFECSVCQARAKPKVARPAAIPRSFQPNKVIGVDLVSFEMWEVERSQRCPLWTGAPTIKW